MANQSSHGFSQPRKPQRVLLVGWDAADWRVLHPLIDCGRLPTLARIIAHGAMGDLANVPPTLAPLTWTTVATGLRADRHGILAEREHDSLSGSWRPVSCRSRTAKAVWNIATQTGLRSVVVNWAASHPAEPILGVCVDERITSVTGPPGKDWPMPADCVHPAERAAGLADLRMHPAELPAEAMLPFVPGLAGIHFAGDPRPRMIAAGLAATISVHNVATELCERDDWQFAAIRYHFLEPLGQVFMRYRDPPLQEVSRQDAELYGGVVDAGCELLDSMLDRLLALAGPDTTLLLVSDHGFQSSASRPRPAAEHAGPACWHRSLGILVVAGPGVRSDQLVHGANLLDIAPTVLGLLGLPVAEDMTGRTLAEAFERPPETGRIPSWEAVDGDCGRHAAGDDAPWHTQEVIRDLVALGYKETSPAEEARLAAAEAYREFHRALAQLQTADEDAAIQSMRRVLEAAPDHLQARLFLASSLLAKGDVATCRRLAAESSADRRLLPFAELLLGMAASSEGKGDEAIAHFAAAERIASDSPFVLCQVGWAHLGARRHAEAERAFRAARVVKADCISAAFGLAVVHSACGRPSESADEALTAIGHRYFFPEAHAQLGVALIGLRRIDRAIQAFETSLAQRPSVVAHEWLACIHEQATCSPEKAATHRAAARALREHGMARRSAGKAAMTAHGTTDGDSPDESRPVDGGIGRERRPP